MDMTLSKNRSGSWGQPKRPGVAQRLSELKGWQRLWVLSGIVYLLMLVATGSVLMPDRTRIEKAMVFAVTEEVRKYDGLAYVGESPQEIFDAARKSGYKNWISQVRKTHKIEATGNAGFEKIDKDYHQAVEQLAKKRFELSGLLVLGWLIPMAALYACGYAIEWVRTGKTGLKSGKRRRAGSIDADR